MLKPFLRENLDILFIGLNPAVGSARKGHYFSVNSAFWNQLYASGLITEPVLKDVADDNVFGSTKINHKNWQYGITDLLPNIVNSDSSSVKPMKTHWDRLKSEIIQFSPNYAVVLHSKVLRTIQKYEGGRIAFGTPFQLGQVIKDCSTEFVNIPFPHGNAITSNAKIELYTQLWQLIEDQQEGVK